VLASLSRFQGKSKPIFRGFRAELVRIGDGAKKIKKIIKHIKNKRKNKKYLPIIL
jgi:hypothetical protein